MCTYNGGTLRKSQSQQHEDTRHEHNICPSYGPAMQSTKLWHTQQNLMAHELARRPATMFDDRGAMKVAKTKLFWRLIGNSIRHGYRHSRLHAKLRRIHQHLPSPHPAMWNPVTSTRWSTDARKAVPFTCMTTYSTWNNRDQGANRLDPSVFSKFNSQTSFSERCSHCE